MLRCMFHDSIRAGYYKSGSTPILSKEKGYIKCVPMHMIIEYCFRGHVKRPFKLYPFDVLDGFLSGYSVSSNLLEIAFEYRK